MDSSSNGIAKEKKVGHQQNFIVDIFTIFDGQVSDQMVAKFWKGG